METIQIFKFGIMDHAYSQHLYYHELVDDVPRYITKMVKPDMYNWLSECYPETTFGIMKVILDPYQIFTMCFQDVEELLIFKLTWPDYFINACYAPPEVLRKYF